MIEGLRSKIEACMDDARYLISYGKVDIHVSIGKGSTEGIKSINVIPDEICLNRYGQYNNSICSRCIGIRSLCRNNTRMVKALVYNYALMSLPVDMDKMPTNLYGPVSINRYGRIINRHHAQYIVGIARLNKKAMVSVVDQSPHLIWQSVRTLPSNLIVIGSHETIDDLSIIEKCHKTICIVSSITEEMILNKDIYVCKNRCIDCHQCYTRNGAKVIVRQLSK